LVKGFRVTPDKAAKVLDIRITEPFRELDITDAQLAVVLALDAGSAP
jgi:hypothetical protein